jgi:hypothetical protein
MGFSKTLARASVLWGQENALDVLSAVCILNTRQHLLRKREERRRTPCARNLPAASISCSVRSLRQ